MTARRSASLFATLLLLVAAIIVGSVPATAASKGGAPSASFIRQDLSGGTHAGTTYATGGLTLSGSLATGVYTDPFGYGAVAYESGSWTSPLIDTPFAFDELVASWNAATPESTWIKVEVRGTGAGRTTKWYTLQI
ncbi:MAG: peptidase C39 family protein, partial [Candidatus Limnocylindria bacterium]